MRKAGKDAALGSEDVGFLVSGEAEEAGKSRQEAQLPPSRPPVILDSVPAVVEAVMPTLAVASPSRSEGNPGAKQRSQRRRNLEVDSVFCPVIISFCDRCIRILWVSKLQPPSPSPAASGSSTTAPTPSGYASDDDDDFLGNDDDSLDGEGGGGGIDEADDEDRIPEELLLKYANEAGIDKGKF